MLYRGKPMHITADQVSAVRDGVGETQDEFAKRFSRSRFAIIRWEQRGVVFKYGSRRYDSWHGAITQAIFLTTLRTEGTDHEQIEDLQALRIL